MCLRGLVRSRVLIKFYVVTKNFDGSLTDLTGVVVCIPGNAKRADKWKPSGDSSTNEPLRYFYTYSSKRFLCDLQACTPNEKSLTQTCYNVAQRMSSGMTKETIKHCFFSKVWRFTEDRRYIRNQLGLNSPNRAEIGENRN